MGGGGGLPQKKRPGPARGRASGGGELVKINIYKLRVSKFFLHFCSKLFICVSPSLLLSAWGAAKGGVPFCVLPPPPPLPLPLLPAPFCPPYSLLTPLRVQFPLSPPPSPIPSFPPQVPPTSPFSSSSPSSSSAVPLHPPFPPPASRLPPPFPAPAGAGLGRQAKRGRRPEVTGCHALAFCPCLK